MLSAGQRVRLIGRPTITGTIGGTRSNMGFQEFEFHADKALGIGDFYVSALDVELIDKRESDER